MYWQIHSTSRWSRAFSNARDALALWPIHTERSVYLNSLAIALPSHYKENGVIEILDEAIRLRREFVSFRPPGHRYRAGAISGLVKL
jgi:hypothetical protein